MSVRVFPFLRCTGLIDIAGVTFGPASLILGSNYSNYLQPFVSGGQTISHAMACRVPDEDVERGDTAEAALRFHMFLKLDLFFEHTNGYWITPSPSPSDPWIVRTRIGGIAGNAAQLRIAPPWPLLQETVHFGNMDFAYASLLAPCGQNTASAPERRLFRAAQFFSRAHGFSLNWEAQVLMLAAASEALLDVPDQSVHQEFAKRFQALFDNSWAIYFWADDFYTLRS